MDEIKSRALTIGFTATVVGSIKREDIKIVAIASNSGCVIIIVLNNEGSKSTNCYSGEHSIFGKSMRLLYCLHKKHDALRDFKMLSNFHSTSIIKIIVTTCSNPQDFNAVNHYEFGVENLLENFRGIDEAESNFYGMEETLLKTLIEENQ